VESADTIGFLIASVVIIVYRIFGLDLIYIVGFSFVTFAVSWFPYVIYEKTRRQEV
jgi:hypothetical protein